MDSGSVRASVTTGHWSWVNFPPKVEVHNGDEQSGGRGGLVVQECGTVAELLSEASFARNRLGGEANGVPPGGGRRIGQDGDSVCFVMICPAHRLLYTVWGRE